jgi:hypothetical protein
MPFSANGGKVRIVGCHFAHRDFDEQKTVPDLVAFFGASAPLRLPLQCLRSQEQVEVAEDYTSSDLIGVAGKSPHNSRCR